MGIGIDPLYLTAAAIVWLVTYHVAYAVLSIASDRSLVCWSIGPLGISVVPLREPSLRQVALRLAGAALVLAAAVYATLYLIMPAPVTGLGGSLPAVAIAVAGPVALFTLWRVGGIFRTRHYPLWGEARVMAAVQRSLASGAFIVFTPGGREFVRDRFGATPGEFLRMVRY